MLIGLMKRGKIGIYVASPCGFCPESYAPGLRKIIIPAIQKADRRIKVINPWDVDYSKQLKKAEQIGNRSKRVERFHELDMIMGRGNRDMIDESRAMVAVLNGNDVDSGVAAEIVYAAAKGKPVLGYRDDFRPAGENEGTRVNLQLQYFIEMSGGWIVNSADKIPKDLRRMLRNAKILR